LVPEMSEPSPALRPDLLALFFRIVAGERPRPASSELADLQAWQAEAARLQELEQLGLLDPHLMKTERHGAELYFMSYPILSKLGKQKAEELGLES